MYISCFAINNCVSTSNAEPIAISKNEQIPLQIFLNILQLYSKLLKLMPAAFGWQGHTSQMQGMYAIFYIFLCITLLHHSKSYMF